MPQTRYNRPWPRWVILAVAIPLTALLVAIGITQGLRSAATLTVFFADISVLFTLTILDPEVTIEGRKVMPDGNVATVRRPIVGFKRCERVVGVTGGYEVRFDGFRYEEAYIRI